MYRYHRSGLGLVFFLCLTLAGWVGSVDPLLARLLPENFPVSFSNLVEERPEAVLVNNHDNDSDTDITTTLTRQYRVRSGDTLRQIARNFQVDWRNLAEKNELSNPNLLQAGQIIWIPSGARVPSGSGSGSDYAWPVIGRITSHYGYRGLGFHYGLDIAAPLGTAIRAAASGIVSFAGWKSGYGYLVIIEHDLGSRSLYAHASQVLVHPGERVSTGQVIAEIGSTGRSTGPHLHFELEVRGRRVNPIPYLW